MAKKSSEVRKEQTEKRLKEMGIAYNRYLPLIESSEDVVLKGLDDICKRAIACLISIQVGLDIGQSDYEESKEFFADILSKYGVESCLNEKEKRLFNGNCSKQDAIDVVWTYEAYWSLVWALGLIDDISNAVEICDCQKAISLVSECGSLEEFKKQCHVRDIEEILDMLDLYYRYDWACTEKRFNPQTSIGGLNPEVVVERRKGLEWLISEENDWFDISLDT